MKKLGFLVCSTGWGGLEMNVIRLSDWMKERGWNITFFAYEGTKVAESAIQNNHKLIPVKKHKKYFDFSNAFRLSKLLKKEEIEILFVFDNKDLDLTFLTKTFYNTAIKVIYQQQMQIGVKKTDWLHTMRYNSVDIWISPLNWLKEELAQKTKFKAEKVRVIPLNTEVEKYLTPKYSKESARLSWAIPIETFTLGIIGRIDPKKGQLFVAQAIQKLVKRGNNIQLLIVGDATINDPAGLKYFKSLESFIIRNNLQDHIYLKEATPDTLKFYNAIDLFVMASHGETFGMVTIESMLSGIPIIGTNTAGTPEILENGNLGSLFEYENEEDFIEKVEKILENYPRYNSLAAEAQQLAKVKYSHITECEQMEKIIKELS